MDAPKLVPIAPQPISRFEPVLEPAVYREMERVAERSRQEFEGTAIWHISSTARGGGVAEILHALLPYVRGAGVDTRWVVLRDGGDFFTVTKRIHNRLHEDPGDGGELGEEERRIYEAPLAGTTARLSRLLQSGDVVYLHDPQTAGLVRRHERAGGQGRLALPHRCRRAGPVGPFRLGLPAPVRRERGRLRLLPPASTPGTGSTRRRCG